MKEIRIHRDVSILLCRNKSVLRINFIHSCPVSNTVLLMVSASLVRSFSSTDHFENRALWIDSNENSNQFDSPTDYNSFSSTSNYSTQQTNPPSSQQNRYEIQIFQDEIDRIHLFVSSRNYPDQQQQTFNTSRNNSRQYQNRPIKKRKQVGIENDCFLVVRCKFVHRF